VDGGGHDLGGEGGGLRWQGMAREIQYIITIQSLIWEIQRLDNPFYYLIRVSQI